MLTKVIWVASACLLLEGAHRALAAETILPDGAAPPAIVSRHFPDRVHEFVWRNWNAVEPAKLAKILGTTIAEVAAVAESMGLPPSAAIPPEMKSVYQTVTSGGTAVALPPNVPPAGLVQLLLAASDHDADSSVRMTKSECAACRCLMTDLLCCYVRVIPSTFP